MPAATDLSRRLGLSTPLIQAPMGGSATTVELVAAVCEAGALGSFGAAYMTPAAIAEACAALRRHTSRPFGINLFAPTPPPPGVDAGPALARVAPFFAALGLPAPDAPAHAGDPFAGQFEAVLDSGAAVFSFTFGLLPEGAVAAAQGRGMMVMGTATTVDEAIALEAAGVDAVVAQGSEAGAHRGTFAAPFEAAMIGTMALVPQIVDAVSIPVVASGGIMDGRGIAAALALGAGAAALGTAFLPCDETGIPESYKRAVLAAREDATRVTRAFSGRHARGIANRFMDEIDAAAAADGAAILPFPLQNALTRPLRAAAGQAGRPEFLSLWAGQGVRLARQAPAAALVARLTRETDDALARMGRLAQGT